MPKVSIIVPVYKAEKYLNRCVDSILAQTFTDWDLTSSLFCAITWRILKIS